MVRTLYTIVTPLPSTVSRATAINALHDHGGMIGLSPVVQHYEKTKPNGNAPADEFHCTWYSITDKISYFPGIKGQVTYKVCFHDLPNGMQSHCYAPAGLDLKGKWSVGGNEPGEEREVRELGLVGVPREGLYLREDIDMKCNVLMTGFVKKTLKRSHEVLVDRLVVKADLADDHKVRQTYASGAADGGGGGGRGSSAATSPTASDWSAKTRVAGLGLKDMQVQELPVPGSPPYPDERSRESYASPTSPATDRSMSVRSGAGSSVYNDRRLSMPRPPQPQQQQQQQPSVAELPGEYNMGLPYEAQLDWSLRKDDLVQMRPLFANSNPMLVHPAERQRAELP